jgi:N-acetylmuramoyl-L-alanine amidase
LSGAKSALVLLFLGLTAEHPAAGAARRVSVSEDFAAVLDQGAITVEARPLDGETPIEFARRLARDDATAQKILALPGWISRPRTTVILSYAGLSEEGKRAAVAALFPADVRATAGWLHIAVDEESLGSIAEWFTGTATNAAALARENRLETATISRGTTVRVPAEILLPPFRDAEALDEAEPPNLTFGTDEKGPYAIYRLRKKEALYSAVVVRFTGRVHAPDVIELALKVALRSDIDDVHAIPVGYPVKIPLDVLSAEYLPKDDPRAQALEKEKAEAAQFSTPVKATGLAGVRVVIDAGHGGHDTGTIHGGLWESTYVYDVACRLAKLLGERTKADVVMTTEDPSLRYGIPDRDVLAERRSRVLLTSPPYDLEDPVVGVNLRWYLANSLLKRPGPGRKKIPPERTVFLSLHADSLHPSLRGAMAYVPGERFLRDRYGKTGAAFAVFSEFREQPVVSFNKKERVSSEGASTALAGRLVGAMKDAGLPIHPFSPVRTHVIRSGREWVPAVLRYNRIPNRVLLEIANLANEDDRALLVTRKFRQKVADSIAAGLVDFFGGEKDENGTAPLLAQRRAEKGNRSGENDVAPASAPPEMYGPWEIYGPMPQASATPGRISSPSKKSPVKSPVKSPLPSVRSQKKKE